MTTTRKLERSEPGVKTVPRRPSAWVVHFPRHVRDARGATIVVGTLVRILSGPNEHRLAEVTGWGGNRGVEVLLAGGRGDDALPSDQIEVVADRTVDVMFRSVENATVIEEPPVRSVVIHPVGGQDVVLARRGEPGPFPDPADYTSERYNDQVKVDARRWGLACLAAVEGLPPSEQEQLVAAWLSAPLLERVLNEGPLPERVDRLCLVVTDQDPPFVDDTFAFGDLLALWVAGMAAHRHRVVDEVVEPITLRSEPHISDTVTAAVRAEVPRVVDGCDQVVVVQAGGTPAMAVGITFGVVLGGGGVDVRQLYVPRDQPLRAVDLPALIRRSALYEAVERFLELRQPAPAAKVLAATTAAGNAAGEAADLAAAVDVLGCMANRDLVAARAQADDLDAVGRLGNRGRAVHRKLREVLDSESPGDVRAFLVLAGWDAVAAYKTGDRNRFVSQLTAIDDNLPAHWFWKNGFDPTDGASLKSAFEQVDWPKFAKCKRRLHEPNRLKLANGDSNLDLNAAAELFACLDPEKPCHCSGLGVQWDQWPNLAPAAEAFARRRRGTLRTLRNAGLLGHGVSAVSEDELDQALANAGVRVDDVQAWLRTRYNFFRLGLPDDALWEGCRLVGERLQALSS